jgi:hypothetical protein
MIYYQQEVTRYSSLGHPYRVVETSRMPRIREEFLECVVYLYPSIASAQQGAGVGGTGFMVCVPSAVLPELSYIYIITNRHVIENRATVVRINTQSGMNDVIDLNRTHWYYDPNGNDLAISNFSLNMNAHKIKAVRSGDFISHSIMSQFGIGPGDDAFMVGRFIHQDGRQKNSPTVRFGSIAMMPGEPLYHSMLPSRQQESFLVEVRSISGYSGSPVFVHIPPFATRAHTPDIYSQAFGPWLLGINWGNVSNSEPVRDKDGNETKGNYQDWHVNSPTGMAAVIPAWHLTNLLNAPGVAMNREANDKQLADNVKRGSTVLNSAPNPGITTGEFEDALKKVSRRLTQPQVPPAESEGSSPPES